MLRYDLWEKPVWVAIISTKRPKAPANYADMIGKATWYVCPGEGEAYKQYGAAATVEVVGLCEARNRALKDAFERGVPCIQLSDDLGAIKYAVEREDSTADVRRYKRAIGTLADLVSDLGNAAMEVGAKLAGVAPTSNLLAYGGEDNGKGTRTKHFILGDCMLIFPNECRFDTSMRLKEDYDYTAQVLQKYHCVARREKWLLEYAHWTNAGGAVDTRTSARERDTVAYLRGKWGEEVFRPHPTRPTDVLFKWVASPRMLGYANETLWGENLPAIEVNVPSKALARRKAVKATNIPRERPEWQPRLVAFTWTDGSLPQHDQQLISTDYSKTETYALKQVAQDEHGILLWVVPFELRDQWDTEWKCGRQDEFEPAPVLRGRHVELESARHSA